LVREDETGTNPEQALVVEMSSIQATGNDDEALVQWKLSLRRSEIQGQYGHRLGHQQMQLHLLLEAAELECRRA